MKSWWSLENVQHRFLRISSILLILSSFRGNRQLPKLLETIAAEWIRTLEHNSEAKNRKNGQKWMGEKLGVGRWSRAGRSWSRNTHHFRPRRYCPCVLFNVLAGRPKHNHCTLLPETTCTNTPKIVTDWSMLTMPNILSSSTWMSMLVGRLWLRWGRIVPEKFNSAAAISRATES